jgi:hypothetical protein
MSDLSALYGHYDDEQANEDKNKTEGGGDLFKFKTGDSVLRFLPPAPGERSPFVQTWNHFIETGPNEGIGFNCPRKMGGGHCPSCEIADKLAGSTNKAEREAAWGYKPKLRFFSLVVDRDNEAAGPQAVAFGKTIFEQLSNLRTGRAGGNFTDPTDKGFDVIVNKKGEKKKTEYVCTPDRANSPLHPDQDLMIEWLQNRPDVSKYLVVLDLADIMELGEEKRAFDVRVAQPQSLAREPNPRLPGPPSRPGAVNRNAAAPASRGPSAQPTRTAADDDDVPFG